jgi:DNA polymerase I
MAAQSDLFSDEPKPAPAVPSTAPKTVCLIDASGFVFRAYHALPPLSTSQGVVTHAVLGFTRMLLKLMRERNPTHLALCFDVDSRKGRLSIDPQYKANREEAPADLKSQFSLIYQVARVLNVATLESPGWEADDVIATMTATCLKQGFHVDVVTSDKDFAQLLVPGVTLFDPMKDKVIDEAAVLKKFGVPPSQMRDYQALVGDAIDNVPKVPGIGPKTAVELLREFGSIAALLERVADVSKPKIRDALVANAEQLKRALSLVSFRDDLVLPLAPEDLRRKEIDATATRALFSELEFYRLLPEIPAAPTSFTAQPHTVVDSAELLIAMEQSLTAVKTVAMAVSFEGEPQSGHLTQCVLGHRQQTFSLPPNFLLAHKEAFAACLRRMRPEVVTHDAKVLWHALATLEVDELSICADAELSAYLLNPTRKDNNLAQLLRERASLELESVPEGLRLAAAVSALPQMVETLDVELKAAGLNALLTELELPLTRIVQKMERQGILVDLKVLAEVATTVEQQCERLLSEVYVHAGRSFNVASPPQLAQVLFEDLKLPVLKKGKTGPSTDHEVLEKLAEQHPLPQAIIEYRNVAKLKSTYLDTLPTQVGPDGRIRTTLQQAAVATGRLSSVNPNLQNIPVRNEIGRRIRQAFVAPVGCQLISADYSQIELRILAHIAQDEALIEAFTTGADVHVRTAAEVFGVSADNVTAEHRRAAKMVNYGIAYGLSAHGLAARLNIGNEAAKKIIDDYFARFPGIARYMETTVEQGKKEGFVSSLFGRRRPMPELLNKNRSIAMAAERAAINMPIQGTAADIIKRAMLVVDAELTRLAIKSKMLLQVHDELLFEVADDELETVKSLAVQAMEGAAKLKVPLQVDIGVGHSWADAH